MKNVHINVTCGMGDKINTHACAEVVIMFNNAQEASVAHTLQLPQFSLPL